MSVAASSDACSCGILSPFDAKNVLHFSISPEIVNKLNCQHLKLSAHECREPERSCDCRLFSIHFPPFLVFSRGSFPAERLADRL